MYTSHGHHIPFTNLDLHLPRPDPVLPCGGVRLCPQCTLEGVPHVPGLKKMANIPNLRENLDLRLIFPLN